MRSGCHYSHRLEEVQSYFKAGFYSKAMTLPFLYYYTITQGVCGFFHCVLLNDTINGADHLSLLAKTRSFLNMCVKKYVRVKSLDIMRK